MIKPCKWCGTPFDARGKARYCQDACRVQWDRTNDKRRDQKPSRQIQKARISKRWYERNKAQENARSRAHYYENRERFLAYQQEYYRKKRAGELIARSCRCGKTFWIEKHSRRWFCTRECRYEITLSVTRWLVELLHRKRLTSAQRNAGQR